jgi:hypothetical protein
MKNTILIHIVLLTMILVTSSCTLQQTAMDPLTILAMKTCEPPCWQGITPGITTATEANILVQQISFFPERPSILAPSNIYTDEVYGPIVRFLEPNVEVNVFADEQGIVDRIIFGFDDNNRPKLGDCIDLFGEPQYIGMIIVNKVGRSFFEIAYPQILMGFSRSMAFRPDTVRIPYSSGTRLNFVVYHSEEFEQPDYSYYFPWNEKAILQFEKNY